MIEAYDCALVIQTYSMCQESMAYLNSAFLCVNSKALPVHRALFYASVQ